MEDGLYFNLPESEYFDIPRLSASGIKKLMIDPLNYWHSCSWLNPFYKRRESDAMALGSAFHRRILEGSELFYKHYAPDFEASDDCVKGTEEIKECIRNLGTKPKGRKKAEYIAQLQELDPSIQIYDLLEQEYESTNAGKEFLSDSMLREIEYTAAMIEKDPIVSKCFSGGMPEVTVLWTEDDVQFKARLDYLKPRAIIDLKTFSNPMEKPIDSAIYAAMATRKYHVQAAFYMRAAAKAAEFAESYYDPFSEREDIEEEFNRKLASTKEFDFYFVFRQTTEAPLVRAKKFERGMMWSIGETIINDAVEKYKECQKIFGTDPWIIPREIESFEDSNFPPWMSEL